MIKRSYTLKLATPAFLGALQSAEVSHKRLIRLALANCIAGSLDIELKDRETECSFLGGKA